MADEPQAGGALLTTMILSRSEHVAGGAALAIVLWFLALPAWVRADELVYRWLQFRWSGPGDRFIVGLELALRITLGTVVACVALVAARKRPAAVLSAAVLVGSGVILCEFLKTAFERLRPESLPAMSSGNSFPSGHIMSTTLVALAACRLAGTATRRLALRRLVYATAALCVVAQGLCRVAQEAHWLSDIPVSVLLATAWVYGAPVLGRLPVRGRFTAAAGFASAFLLFYLAPSMRIHLPSAMDQRVPALSSIEFGLPVAAKGLGGSWKNGPDEPVGPVAWALSREFSVRLPVETGQAAIMKLVVRPQSCGVENLHVNPGLSVSVNGRSFPEFRLRRGWREYHLVLPADLLSRGPNTVTFQVDGERVECADGADQGLVAFRYLRLFPLAAGGFVGG